jgi:flagella basal body P-ring formation protein FlgA
LLLLALFVCLAGAGVPSPAQSASGGTATGSGVLNEEAAAAILRIHIAAMTGRAESDVIIHSLGGLTSVELPAAPHELRVMQKSVLPAYQKVHVPVEVLSAGRSVRTFWLTVDASVNGIYLKAARRIPYGAAIGAMDVEMVRGELPDLRLDYFESPDEVDGKTARRTLSAGDPLTRDVLANPYLVRSGETVRLRLDREGVALAAMVRAEQHGKLGQVIRVRNLEFGRPSKARVVARGEVRME